MFGMRRGFCGTVAFKPRPWLSLGGEWGEVTQMVLMWETAWHTRVTGTGVTWHPGVASVARASYPSR